MEKNIYQKINESTTRIIHVKSGKSCLIDSQDERRVRMFNWYPSKGLRNKSSYFRARIPMSEGKVGSIYLHRLIMSFPISGQIDHIDGDGLNNTRKNLRAVSAVQNACNQKRSRGIDLPKGVHYVKTKTGKPYRASKITNGKSYHLGVFESAEEASKAFRDFESKVFRGEV